MYLPELPLKQCVGLEKFVQRLVMLFRRQSDGDGDGAESNGELNIASTQVDWHSNDWVFRMKSLLG